MAKIVLGMSGVGQDRIGININSKTMERPLVLTKKNL